MNRLSDVARKRLYFWCGLVAIVLLYCGYYLSFIFGSAVDMPLKARHIVKFLFILGAYAVGVFALRRNTAGWMMQLWHIIYALVGLLLISLGVYDWVFARAPLQIRIIADDLQEFLVSPILYVAMGIIGRRLAAVG